MRFPALLLMMFTIVPLFCATLEVDIDGGQAYTSIQLAIDDAQNGDLVLVHPGTYHENLVIEDKFITLASLNLTTGQPPYIHYTILDGSFSGSVIRADLETVPQPADLVIHGFTIVHGSGSIRNPAWPSNTGGGISIECDVYEYMHDVQITNCQIKYNESTSSAGMALLYWGNYHLRNVSVHDNISDSGPAGVTVGSGRLITYADAPCSFYSNTGSSSHDLYLGKSSWDVELFADSLTVAAPYPSFVYMTESVTATDSLSLSIVQQHHVTQEIDHDIYVAPDGDDENSGLSASDPWQSIRKACYYIASNPENPRTIHLAAGEYSETQNNQNFGVGLKAHVNLIGAGIDQTVLRNEEANDLIRLALNNNTVQGLSITSTFEVQQEGLIWNPHVLWGNDVSDIRLENIRIHDMETGRSAPVNFPSVERLVLRNVTLENIAGFSQAGLGIHGRDITIDDCTIRNNHVWGDYPEGHADPALFMTLAGHSRVNGLIVMNCSNAYGDEWHRTGMINCGLSSAESNRTLFTNCLFADNTSPGQEGIRIWLHTGQTSFTNCTFVNNTATQSFLWINHDYDLPDTQPFEFNNCILWNETEHEVTVSSYFDMATEVQYSLVRDGMEGFLSPNDSLYWGEGNLAYHPRLTGPETLYLPTQGCPVVNTGTPDTTGLCLPPHDLMHRTRVWDGQIDIGCHEFGAAGTHPDATEIPPDGFTLSSYPNPFNPSTRITFTLPEVSNVQLAIYNIRGQRVATLARERFAAGSHSVVWDGKNDDCEPLAGGVYLLRLTTGHQVTVRKILLLK